MSKTNSNITLPTVALRGMVLFPGMDISIEVGRLKSVSAVRTALAEGSDIFLTAQKDFNTEDPAKNDVYSIGTIAKVNRILRLPGTENIRVSIQGIRRAKIVDFFDTGRHIVCTIAPKNSVGVKSADPDYLYALLRKAKSFYEEYTQYQHQVSSETLAIIHDCDDADKTADLISGNIFADYHERQALLSEFNTVKRLEKLCTVLQKEVDILKLESEISEKVQDQIDKGQREYYLHEQLKVISKELNEEDSTQAESEVLREKILALGLQKEYEEKLLKECSRLEKFQSHSPDANVLRVYLETCVDLPWNKFTKDNLDLNHARKILGKDHTGLEKVKDRIIEFLAVRNLTENQSAQIICLVGPPGVGKTSIARSVAEAMGRKFARISLGGVSDEAEIRGHRKTYIGSMPGRIINAVSQSKVNNPLILLDEIDKLGSDYKGDPSAALLEALDPEQNKTFTDHYIEIPFDLSKVLFITTANDRSTIPSPLLDRMEIIELSSYTRNEKFKIAKNHLVSKQKKLHGIQAAGLKISDSALFALIDGYTREAGVRRLEQQIASLCRKSAVAIVKDGKKRIRINAEDLESLLGPAEYIPETIDEDFAIGLVNGLAWTAVGGEMLRVEASVLEGSGKVELTGSLGDVMKESARAAVTYVRAHAEEYSIDNQFYKTKDIHIHVPEGAVPKDGPSAGVTLATALVSALSKIPANQHIAMTGEISLTGRVLPIGGLREKSMAAYKMGINKVIIPEKNLPDLRNIDSEVKDSIEFVPVRHLSEVLSTALAGNFAQGKPQNNIYNGHNKPYTGVRA